MRSSAGISGISVGHRGARLVRRDLGDQRDEFADEPGLLRTHERLLEDLAQRVHRDDLDLALVAILQEDILHVRAWNHDSLNAEFRCGLNLRGHTADGEDLPANAQGARHRNALVDGDLFQGADDGGRHRDGRAIALGAFPGTDELDVDVVVGDVFARVLLDEGGDVLDRLLGDFSEAARRDNAASLFRLRGSDFCGDGEHDATELRDRIVADQHREPIDHADDSAFRDERLILLAPLDHPVRDLLFERPCDPLRVYDMLCGDERRRLFLRNVPCHSDEAAELAQPQRQLTAAAGSALGLPQDLQDRAPVEVRNLPVLGDLLRDEPNALVGLVNRPGLDALMRGRLEASALERIVLHVPEEGTRVAARRIDERRHLIRRVTHEELRYHEVLLSVSRVPRRDVDDRRHENAKQDDVGSVGTDLRGRGSPLVREDDAQPDDEEDDRHDHGGFLFPALHRLRLLRVDDLAALPGGHDANLRLVRIFWIVVDDDVLEVVPGEHFRHRPGGHRFPGARVADQHHMPLLLGGFADHLDGSLLTDDLVDEPLGNLYLGRGTEIDLVNPRINRGEFFRVSRRLHHLLTGPSLGSRSNTRAFYLNTSLMLPRSSWRKSHTVRCKFSWLERYRRGRRSPLSVYTSATFSI